MKSFLLALLLLLAAPACVAQIIIDLDKGGASVRSKTMKDFDRQNREPAFEREDSIAYRDCLVRGFSALAADSLDEARGLLEKALKVKPGAAGNHIIRHNLARIAMAQDRWNDALTALGELLKEYPKERDIRRDRAKTYLQLHMAAEAIADCDVLLASGSPDAAVRRELLFLKASALMEQRLYAEARANLGQVLAQEPDNENAQLLYVASLAQDGRPQEAMARISTLIAQRPKCVEALVMRAQLETESGQLEAARYDLDAAIALAPSDASLYLTRAALLLRLNLPVAARRDVEKVNALTGMQLTLSDLDDKK